MSGSLVADLGVGPGGWLVLTFLTCQVLYFKFGRLWSIRNLDLLLLFAPAPGLLSLVGSGEGQPWWAFVWLFAGSALWVARCLIDLGLTRRPILEPNLNWGGLACLLCGMLGLLLAETVNLPETRGSARNPADPHADAQALPPAPRADSTASERTVHQMLNRAAPPGTLKRVLAVMAHMGLVMALLAIGWRHFERPILGLAMAVCYLVLPYTRIAVVDTGQLVPAALIVGAVLCYQRPALAGAMLGVAAAWMPATLGLIPLWAGFYWGRGARRFLAWSLGILLLGGGLAWWVSPFSEWSRAVGARTLAEAGLTTALAEAPRAGSFWTGVDPVYRLPILIAYLAFVVAATIWPLRKNLAQLLALSAALLVANQFWYLDEGGTLVLLYLPLLLLMIFRPNLSAKRPPPNRSPRSIAKTLASSR